MDSGGWVIWLIVVGITAIAVIDMGRKKGRME